ncbi:hypothetical protein NDU88_007393 [Pleurodeles waltl]|uniref:Uncharacterized protein n=1 Tax=Pleurodeles waltl TaxID=8319 RepID=A0AAV7NA28_PLEWA|nr:hypothetical protein NDU88_007393 [Pleurodeles waltl]
MDLISAVNETIALSFPFNLRPTAEISWRIRSMVDSWAESVMSWCVAGGSITGVGRGPFVWRKASEKSNCLAGLPEFLWDDRPPGSSCLVAEPDNGAAGESGSQRSSLKAGNGCTLRGRADGKRVSAREEKASVGRYNNVATARGPQTSAGRGKGAPLGRVHRFHKRCIKSWVVSRRALRQAVRPSTPGPRNDERREGDG